MARAKNPSVVTHVLQKFDAACQGLAVLVPGARLLLGCSAGGDSMSLLDLAAGRARARGWVLAVVHLDHAQRAESAGEAAFVLAAATRYELPFFAARIDAELAAASPLSEEVLREARHACFRRFSAEWDADVVLLAHQADDRAETLLIRLLAGSGPTGLAGIRAMERIGALTVARPLLGLRRAELREYLTAREIEWRDDPSNDLSDNKRGFIRNTLLPMIHEKIGLDPTERLARAAELIGDESSAASEAVSFVLRTLRLESTPPILDRLDLTAVFWREAGRLLRRQLVREWLRELRRSAYPPGLAAVNEALAFIESAQPRAELRTVERIHIVHAKTSLLAFAPQVEIEQRQAAANPFIPPAVRLKQKKK